MIGKSQRFLGPRALFDPHYVPPRLLYRKEEEHSLFSILKDSFSDNFCLNILYQGIQGIGKKAIVNKVIKDLLFQNKDLIEFNKVNVDCKEKSFEELMFTLLTEMNGFMRFKFDLSSIFNSKISRTWSLFKLSCKKANENIVLILNNIEHLEPGIFKKFLNFSKESNITLISTVNKVLRPTTLDVLSEFDFKKKLNYFTYKELIHILKERVSLAFSHEIDTTLIEFITDLIFEHYVPIPGKGIDIFRDLYPYLKEQKTIENFELLEICQNQFDFGFDEFSMLNYISDEDFLNIIFLDNLQNYFEKNYFINLSVLGEIYEISCETLEYDKSTREFNNLIKMTQNVGILSASKKNLNEKKKFSNYSNSKTEYFFMVINPYKLKFMIDTVFGKI